MRMPIRVMIATRTTIVVIGLLLGLLVTGAPPAPAVTYTPNTSPPAAVRYEYYGSGGLQCQSGYACTTLEYPAGVIRWVFKFYYYGTYSLSHWSGTGWAANSQTGGAAMRLLDRNGYQITCVPAGDWRYVNWDPVWFIRLTSSPC